MKYTIEIYRLNPVANNFERIDIIESHQGLSFFSRLNGVGGARFSLSLFDKKATVDNLVRFKNQVAIKRDNSILFFGPIIDITGGVNGVEGTIDIECASYLYHFRDRFTDKIKYYYTLDQSSIAWDLINQTQQKINGGLSVTLGTLMTSSTRDRTYEFKSVSDAIIGLSNVIGGFDFDFIPVQNSNGIITNVSFNTYYPLLGSLRNDLPTLEFSSNLKKMQFKTNSTIYNSILAEGSGTGDEVINSIQENPFSMEAFTRRENILSLKDISLQDTLDQKSIAFLNEYSTESFTIDVEMMGDQKPSLGEYYLGDTLNINTFIKESTGFANWKRQGRVIEISVNVDQNGMEDVTPRMVLKG